MQVESGTDPAEQVAHSLRAALAGMHKANAKDPIRFPEANGAFPADFLIPPPPVVVDANILRSDILRACRTGQRTVLVTAANAGLLRLFCAEHVFREVVKHSGDWTASGSVSREDFLLRWLHDYLPMIRIVPIEDEHHDWLDPEELARIEHLARPDQDPDDVPSAVLALLLQAFFLSQDRKALRAVYGHVDLEDHQQWVDVLKAGGDAGELGKMFVLVTNIFLLAGKGLFNGARRVVNATSPWALLPVALLLAGGYLKMSGPAKARVGKIAQSAFTSIAGATLAYDDVRRRFKRVAPHVPGWGSLPATNSPGSVLGRACMHTLARSPMPDLSAADLRERLPYLDVPHGEAKVRQVLRDNRSFTEVWKGRWQVGYVAPAVLRYTELNANTTES